VASAAAAAADSAPGTEVQLELQDHSGVFRPLPAVVQTNEATDARQVLEAGGCDGCDGEVHLPMYCWVHQAV